LPLPWSTDILPDAAVLTLIAGAAGGVLGGFAGRAVSFDVARQRAPRFAGVAAWIGVVAAIGIALPMTAHRDWSAALRIEPATAGRANVVAKLSPDAAVAADNAAWFHVISWQGSVGGTDGGLAITDMVKQADGSYRTAEPVSVSGTGKTILRLHSGTSLQAVPIYLPEDRAIPAEGVPATEGTRPFAADKRILQRERIADGLLAALAAAWMAILSWGLLRIERPPAGDRHTPPSPAAPSRRTRLAPTRA
jgi:hypothetical protein